jgi:hypothetical protein
LDSDRRAEVKGRGWTHRQLTGTVNWEENCGGGGPVVDGVLALEVLGDEEVVYGAPRFSVSTLA